MQKLSAKSYCHLLVQHTPFFPDAPPAFGFVKNLLLIHVHLAADCGTLEALVQFAT
jgi:hypothetical protein